MVLLCWMFLLKKKQKGYTVHVVRIPPLYLLILSSVCVSKLQPCIYICWQIFKNDPVIFLLWLLLHAVLCRSCCIHTLWVRVLNNKLAKKDPPEVKKSHPTYKTAETTFCREWARCGEMAVVFISAPIPWPFWAKWTAYLEMQLRTFN